MVVSGKQHVRAGVGVRVTAGGGGGDSLIGRRLGVLVSVGTVGWDYLV